VVAVGSVEGRTASSDNARGQQLTQLWRTRQFEYSWLRSITKSYVDFFDITSDALVDAANTMRLDLTPADKQRLLDAYLHLTPWPDTVAGLRRLRAAGIRLIVLANFSPMMLSANARNAGLSGLFDALVSTDANHTYKPDPRAYRLGMERLHLASAPSCSSRSEAGMQPGRSRSVTRPPHGRCRRMGQADFPDVQPGRRTPRPAGLQELQWTMESHFNARHSDPITRANDRPEKGRAETNH
jgi:2-haloalkanoic acid dehalogenase type II